MHKINLLIFLFLIPSFSSTFGQNLVPNPGFEITTPFCGIFPNAAQFAATTANWASANIGSPDICHTSLAVNCPNAAVGSISPSRWGSEPPHGGDSYAAAITHCSNCASETREYLRVQLTSPLVVGQTYEASMWVSGGENCKHKTNNLGMYFSVNPPSQNNWLNIPLSPQVNETNLVTLISGWQKVSGTFVAANASQYLTIGNFFNDANTNIATAPSGLVYSVYFIDDVEVKAVTVTTVTGDSTICLGDSTTLTASDGGGLYAWATSTNPAVIFSTDSIIKVSPPVTTTYLMYGTDTVMFTVYVYNYPVVNLGNDTTLCLGATLLLDASTPNATYLWQDNSTNPTLLVTQQNTYWVDVTANGCKSSDTIMVYYEPPPIVNLGSDTSLCEGSSLTLNATTPNATYIWNDNSTNATLTVTQSGQYSVSVNVNGCSTTDAINVIFKSAPHVDLGPDTTFCIGEEMVLDATIPNATYNWQNNSTNSTFTVTQAGLYWVQVTANGCQASDTVIVQYANPPIVNLGEDTTLCYNQSIELSALNFGVNYLWQDGSKNSTFLVTKAGTYWVQVSVGNCEASDEINIDFVPCDCSLIVPNAFSPNDDLVNDEFRAIDNSKVELKELLIYDRWGNQVFKAEHFSQSWDGKYKGVVADVGTYFYMIKYKCLLTGKEVLMKGDVTLIR